VKYPPRWLTLLITILIPAIFLLASCAGRNPVSSPPVSEPSSPPGEDNEAPGEDEPPEIGPENRRLSPEELAKYQPNEMGEVMILMYHSIGETEAEWTRTPANFRQDLEELYRQGYRTVSLLDFVNGHIDLPAGTSPVVLTFDDSTRGQFNYIETADGEILDPNSAVGILEDFYAENPDFGRAATFYIFYPQPFRQSPYIQQKLTFLVDNGYEIGNHSYTHAHLGKSSDEEVLRQLALHAGKTSEFIPGYEVRSLALPYGSYPKNPSLAAAGTYQEHSYENEAVLLVGYRPAPSPFAANFNPMRLARIRASETKVDGVGLYDWLAYFQNNPQRRYVSDGNPCIITAPESYREKINLEAAESREIHFYTLEK
jgi:peptidoglycan/xylan/chitin deacetylase (PgdA/CDA1 family)